MYRRSLALLWTGFGISGAAAALDAWLDYMRNAQGVLIGAAGVFFVSAIGCTCFHRLNQTVIVNRGVAEQLRADINRLSNQLGQITGQVDEVQSTVTAIAIEKESQEDARVRAEAEIEARREQEQPLATVHQLRLRTDNHDVIVGQGGRGAGNEREILEFLDRAESRPLPGRFTAS